MIDVATALPAIGVVVFVQERIGDTPHFDFATWDGKKWWPVDIESGGVNVERHLTVIAWEPAPWAEQKWGKVL